MAAGISRRSSIFTELASNIFSPLNRGFAGNYRPKIARKKYQNEEVGLSQ
jgi:hypothetical protein